MIRELLRTRCDIAALQFTATSEFLWRNFPYNEVTVSEYLHPILGLSSSALKTAGLSPRLHVLFPSETQAVSRSAAMASAMLHSALLGRPVIAKPAVFHSNTARRVTVFARERPMIYYPNSEPPAHLDGSTPGDFGWDPVRSGDLRLLEASL